MPIVPRGAGSGLSGGAIAVEGAVTIVMTQMDRILEIDEDDLLVVTQPGILNAELGRAVAERGLFYPPDPASYEICSIGGNLAENSGGLRCVKYGVTRDYVLGLEVVLADGSVIRTGGRNAKDVMGYDLTHLFVGSEGTLGIITEATLRLQPMPAPKLTLLAFFPSVAAAGNAVSRMTRGGLVPVTLELMDNVTIRAVDAALHVGLEADAGAMLMIESDAGGAAAEAELDAAATASEAAGATSIIRSTDPTEADWLREARRKAHWSLEQAGVARMEDIGVPRSRVAELLERHRDADRGARHAGRRLRPCRRRQLPPDVRHGPRRPGRGVAHQRRPRRPLPRGAGARRHDLGRARDGRREARLPRGPARRALRRGRCRPIKAALDPQGILNPGKVFAD